MLLSDFGAIDNFQGFNARFRNDGKRLLVELVLGNQPMADVFPNRGIDVPKCVNVFKVINEKVNA